MSTIVTIFYSNYSGNSKALFQYIKNSQLMDKLTIKFINIDNKTIRQEVLKKFDTVPAVVVLTNDEVSLYCGENAFDWFYNFKEDNDLTQQVDNASNLLQNLNVEQEVKDQPQSNKPKTILEIAAEISKSREEKF